MGLPVISGGGLPLDAKLAYATQLSRADMLPDGYRGKPGNVLLAIEYGVMLDVHPLTAIQHVHVINGRLGLSAELMRAKVRAAGHRLRVIEHTPTSAMVELTTADDPDHTTRVVYTIDDARTAGALDIWWEHWYKNTEGRNRKETWVLPAALADKNPGAAELTAAGAPPWVIEAGPGATKRNENWWRHPAAMLIARATSNAVRAACPEVLMGMDCTDDYDVDIAPVGPLEGPDGDGGLVDDEGTAGAGPAAPDQANRIAELAQRLTAEQSAAATDWREAQGYNWGRLDEAEADAIIGYLEQVTGTPVPG